MEFDLENPLPKSMDKFPLLFRIENDHMPSETYIQSLNSQDSKLENRREIISLIFNFTPNFDPFLSYLAVNYLDRFLSVRSMPEGNPLILQVLAFSCISLASKMRKTVFSVSDLLQNNGDFILDSLTIERMEMLILGALNWRMRSVNPFSFTNYFVSLFRFNDESSIQALKNRANEIILKSQNDIKLMKFKPSIISSSALLFATYELFPMEIPFLRDAIYSCSYVDKDNLLQCYEIIEDIAIEGNALVGEMSSSSCTPLNVLDLRSFNSTASSSENSETSESTSNFGRI